MDINRGILDNLMGRDRNLPKNSKHIRDHYSNSDVCKPFLICFCFNTLFPNTVYDEGPCNKRHDTYLKTMFDNDINRGEHEKGYIKECISWIQRRLQQAEQKTKKNQNTIENKSSLSTERPRQILDRILAIDKDIEEMMNQAALFGENGQIDDSSRCLQEVERLRQRRKEIDLMGDNLLAVVKQQKICEICGAIQTINDTEKRIQMHLEGKIHQGFLRLRTQIETLKIRLEILQQRLEKNRDKHPAIQGENQYEQKERRDKQKEKERERQREKQKERERERERERQKEKEREKEKEKERQRERQKQKQRQRAEKERIEKEKEKEKIEREKVQREKIERQRGERSASKKKKKQHKHKEDRHQRRDSRDRKKKDRSPDRSRQRGGDRYDNYNRSYSKDRNRKDRDREGKKEKKRRERSRSGDKDKDHRRVDHSRSRDKQYRRHY